jgi:hypothetical protein
MLLYKLSIPNTLFHAYLLIVVIVSQLFCNTGAILIFYITVLIKKTTIPESYVRPLLHEWELKNVFTYAAHIPNYRMVSRPSRTVTIRRWEYEIFKWASVCLCPSRNKGEVRPLTIDYQNDFVRCVTATHILIPGGISGKLRGSSLIPP